MPDKPLEIWKIEAYTDADGRRVDALIPSRAGAATDTKYMAYPSIIQSTPEGPRRVVIRAEAEGAQSVLEAYAMWDEIGQKIVRDMNEKSPRIVRPQFGGDNNAGS